MRMKKQRVVIVEDHPMVRERLADLVNNEGDLEVCGEADETERGLELIQKQSPDLVIIDITLKDSSGLMLIRKIRELGMKMKILVISMHDESSYAQRSLRTGANGYITKNCTSEEIVNAIRKVLAGEVYLSQQMTSNVLRGLLPGAPEKSGPRPVERLSDRELVVLEMIGQGSNSRIIAEKLGVGIPTIETYRARIKEKMNLQNAFELQNFAIRWLQEKEQ